MSEVNPIRIQRSRKVKQVSPNGLPIVYVGRPGKYGNPFAVTGEPGHWFMITLGSGSPEVTFNEKHQALQCCVDCYKEYISHEHNAGKVNIFDLKGKNLSCWCPLDQKCHADILLEMANKLP